MPSGYVYISVGIKQNTSNCCNLSIIIKYPRDTILYFSCRFDKLREWRTRLNRRRSNKAKEIPFGLRDQLVEVYIAINIQPLELVNDQIHFLKYSKSSQKP